MNFNYDKFFKLFIHPENHTDRVSFTSSKILLSVVFSFFVFIFFYNLYFISLGDYYSFKAILNYLGLIFIILLFFTIKRYKNTRLPLRFLGFMGYFFITVGIYQAGGIKSNDLYWYLVLVSSNILFVGKRESLILFVLSILSLITFYFIEVYFNYLLPSNLSSSTIHYKIFNAVFITFIISVLTFYMVKGNRKIQLVKSIIQEEKIRNELAIDFHDQIGNKLAALNQLSKLVNYNQDQKKEKQKEALAQIEKYSGEIYGEFKDFLWTQKNENQYFGELIDYLKDFMEEFLRFSDINFYTKRFPTKIPSVSIPFYYSKELIPIFKEAVTNSFKYSQATDILFEVKFFENEVEISLNDNGKGFDLHSVSRGNGLSNITKRASRLKGAVLNIKSNNEGTKVGLKINLTDLFNQNA